MNSLMPIARDLIASSIGAAAVALLLSRHFTLRSLNMSIRRLALLVFLSCAYPLHSAPADTSGSLLSNGDFSKDSKTAGWPDDWAHPVGATWETEGGFRFLRLTSSQPGQTVLVYREMKLPSPPPPALEMKLRVRYSNIKRGKNAWFDARVMAHFKDAAGKVVKPDPGAPSFTGSSEGWIDKSYILKVPPSASVLELMPALFQAESGTLDFARFEIFPATADKLPKPEPIIPSETVAAVGGSRSLPELHVAGNQIQQKDGKAVWLQGLCIDSMEWSAAGEKIQQSIVVATEEWKANVIRLPVKGNFWFGRGPWQKKGEGGLAYRKLVDAAVDTAMAHGAYLALDLHSFGAPTAQSLEFWKDAATRYKNRPEVLFELFNEPHSVSWEVWRNGGKLAGPDNKNTDVGAKENNEDSGADVSTGMQSLIDAIRATGAHNIVIAGGLDWGYDLSGVAGNFALKDHDGGNGIVYSSHIYPWKKDWQARTLDAAAKYPIFVGEVGCPPDWTSFNFIPNNQRTEDLSKPDWAMDVLGMIQKHHLNWTGFSFHPKCGPMVIQDWDYTPTPYWGVYVKAALGGKIYEMKRMR